MICGPIIRTLRETYLSDWRGLLRSNTAQGQQALRRLIIGRLTLTPREDHYEFRGVGTIQPMLGGLVQEMVSPRGTDRWKTPIDLWFPVDGQRRVAGSKRAESLPRIGA